MPCVPRNETASAANVHTQITVPVFPNWSVRRPNLRASRDESELDPAESSKESDTKVYLQRLRSVRSIDEMLDAVGEYCDMVETHIVGARPCWQHD